MIERSLHGFVDGISHCSVTQELTDQKWILLRYEESLSVVLEELVYHEDTESHPISKLSKVWDEGFLQQRIFVELRRLPKLGRSLEEAARY